MPTTMETTTTLNSLLRGEMSALETYRQAIEKFEAGAEGSKGSGLSQLKELRGQHRDAADALWHHIEGHGERPSESSGAWGTWAQLVEGTAKAFGHAAALKALKEGEEHGLKEYLDALEDDSLPADCKGLIRDKLVASQRQHIAALDRLITAQ